MKAATIVRNANCTFFAIVGVATALGPAVLYLTHKPQRGFELSDAAGLLVFIILGIILVASAFWAFRKADNEVPLVLWLIVIGNMVPTIPPTVRQAFMACPPPAVRCTLPWSAPWWSIMVGLIGAVLAALVVWAERQREPRSSIELTAEGRRLKLASAVLALIASALFVWAFYHNYTQTFASEIKDAFERGKIVGQGRVAIGGHDFVRPSEAIITFVGAMAALTAAAGAAQGSYRWVLYAWPFLLGLIVVDLIVAVGTIGAFGWSYRDFTEQYVWFALFFLCCGGFILAWRSRRAGM